MSDPAPAMRRALLAVAVLLLASCGDGEKPHRGYQVMPDMWDTPAYKRQVAMVVPKEISSDGKVQEWPSLLPPVPGTISRSGPAYQLAPTDFAGAQKLVNPLSPTTEVLREGQERFGIYCAVCHGRDGNAANGYVAKYFNGVPSLNAAHLATLSDGELYHIMTVGRGRMPTYAAQLLPDQRWAVVAYVRLLNHASMAAQDIAAQLKADERAAAAKPEDDNLKAAVAADKGLMAQRQRDLDAIDRVGDDGVEPFRPLPEARPEYETPEFPGGAPQEPGK
jgi:mono/diheme cytochrome c family protein